MNGFFVLLKRELKSIKKEKTIMIAILIQFLIASFSSIILIGVMSFYDPTTIGQNTRITIKVGVVGDTSSPMVGLLEDRNLEVTPFSDVTDAEKAFQSGDVDTVMFIPESNTGVTDMKLILPEADTPKTLILMVLNEPLKKYENLLREANNVQLNYKDVEGKPHANYEFLYSLIIPVLMLFPAFIAGSIVVDTISEEIENKTLDTLWSAPVSLNVIFSSKITAAVVTAGIQCILWTILLRLNNFSIQNVGPVLLLSLIIAASISVGAAIIALYFKDRERAQFVYSIVLLTVTGLSYFLNPSPFNIITRLAVGDYYVGASEVVPYLIPLFALGGIFLFVSKRLVAVQS
ncbi:MAG: ABC transporter permease [Dehalococcoidia bacterium]